MPDLQFQIEQARPERVSVAPLLLYTLRLIENKQADAPATPIQAIALRCQVRIEPGRRRYDMPEKDRLLDLFGTPERWPQTVRPMLWTQTSVIVPPFAGDCTVDLPVPCSYDFSLAATKYFHALADGDIPLRFQFSGTIFYQAADVGLQVSQISWDKETAFRLPVAVWKELMDLYYPNSAWLCLRRDVFERLQEFKSRGGIATWEQALDKLLDAAREAVAT